MQQRRRSETPVGPALKAEQVSEFWVFIWSAIDKHARGERGADHDEALRLAVAFERAIDRHREEHDFTSQRFVRDQGPVATALLAHYLLTRIDHWTSHRHTLPGAARRLALVTEATELLGSLLGLEVRSLAADFERLGVGLSQRSVFAPLVREGVIVESLEEGPALPGERKAREAEGWARSNARYTAERLRPRRRRQHTEVFP